MAKIRAKFIDYDENTMQPVDGKLGAKLDSRVPYTGGIKGLNLTVPGIAVLGQSTTDDGYGTVGMSPYIAIQGTTTKTEANGIKLVEVLNGVPTVTPVEVGYGIEKRIDLPWHGNENCLPMFRDDFEYSNVTLNEESGVRKFWVRRGGEWFLQGTMDADGNLEMAGTVNGGAGSAVNITSTDGSIKVDGYDLSVNRPELELFADNETQLIAAWAIAIASAKAARIFITNNITFTANRQFIQNYGSPGIKIEAIQSRWFIAGNYIVDFNNVTLTNIVFRTTGPFYLRVVGGVSSFINCAWIDEAIDTGARKINILVTGAISASTAKIILKTPTHFSQISSDNTTNLIQPFWIKNESDFGGAASARIYIEILEMAAVFEFTRFARVLLTSTVANCPFSVTGDESWFYAPEQEMAGTGNIKATANILRVTAVDKLNAPHLVTDQTAPYMMAILANGDAAKIPNMVIGNSFSGILVLTQSEYDLIELPDSTVLYFIK